jgi:flavin reductase (DIM6/NTAB) family NADH-FMN oxidoreductase RutF
MNKTRLTPRRPIYPSPAALITSADADGRANVITLGEVFNISISQPVIVGLAITKQRYSHELISRGRQFVVNLPTASMVEVVDRCGCVSGRDVDKFTEFGLTAVAAAEVAPPLIAECPVNVECNVIDIRELGDHDLFLGRAVAEHVNADMLDASGQIQPERLDALCYIQGHYAATGRYLGAHGYTRG